MVDLARRLGATEMFAGVAESELETLAAAATIVEVAAGTTLVDQGDELLVDGGVLNNLPLDVMREINPTGPVIAVHVVAQNGPRAKSDFPLALSGWSLMANRWLPWGRRVAAPSVVTTILRSMFVGAEAKVTTMLEAGLADLYLNINASIVGLLEFDTVEKVAQLGYDAARDPIREWVAAGGHV